MVGHPAVAGVEHVRQARDARPWAEQVTARKNEEDLQHGATTGLDATGREDHVERLLERPSRREGSQLGTPWAICGLLQGDEFEPVRAVEHA